MSKRKGIILAGGSGTRLFPSTKSVSKQLLPVYDKPMIYYPLDTLLQGNINDILLISTKEHIQLYKNLLGNGEDFGISISYMIQEKPNGLAEAFIIGEDFIGEDSVALILGDNIFHGEDLGKKIDECWINNDGATIFGYSVANPNRFGVIKFDKKNKAEKIIEKPNTIISNYAVTGLYIFDNEVINISKNLKPSLRGELEITDVNNIYIKNNKMNVTILDKDFTWLDTGTHESLLEASEFVHTIEKLQGTKLACLEETALIKSWISPEELKKRLLKFENNSYFQYLSKIVIKYENN